MSGITFLCRLATCHLPLATLLLAQVAAGCPFCTAVGPSLSQQRESSAVVALGEVLGRDVKAPGFQLHRIIKGREFLADPETLPFRAAARLKPGSLVLLFAHQPLGVKEPAVGDRLSWMVTPVNETSAAYFFKTPSQRAPSAERLTYFAKFLEHADPLVADDAYREFGHAKFDEVGQVADQLSNEQLRAWLQSDRVPEARKGFYGLALGLAQGETVRVANTKFLEELITADASDFRAGFDGVLGGYLLLTGDKGLKQIESRILSNPKAPVGDVRHALTALRFYHEFGKQISNEHLRLAIAHVLDRPEFAEAAITDLARLQGWEACDQIAALYDREAYREPAIRRAIIGYLRANPTPMAAKHLARIRQQDPSGVAAAEEVLSKLGKLPQ